jgi:hypothetical protein
MYGLACSGRVGMSFSLNDSNQVNLCLAGARQVRENTATCCDMQTEVNVLMMLEEDEGRSIATLPLFQQ